MSDKAGVLTVKMKEGETPGGSLARVMLDATTPAAVTVKAFASHGGESCELMDYADRLEKIASETTSGDLKHAERMLTAQAYTLDAVFNALAQRAASNLGNDMRRVECYLRLALKAQSQSRTTLETLAMVKNPPQAIFARQANIAAGHQQINNGSPPATTSSRAGETETTPNKLLETVSHEQRLDPGTPSPTGRADPHLATVGEIHRPQDRAREGRSRPERIPGRTAAGA